ncbi:MAG TPA: hypothetical protein VGB79_06280 [Allosphingosinicella sp.]|jgi:hypothetical protein
MRGFHSGRGAAAAAVFLLFASASPAFAGDEAELACPLAALGEAERDALATISVDRTARNAALAVVARRVRACGDRFRWSAEERSAAHHYVAPYLARERFRAALAGEGLDLARIERGVLADAPLMAAAAARRGSPPELDEHLRRVIAAEQAWVARNEGAREKLRALGGLISATALAEAARLRFTRE